MSLLVRVLITAAALWVAVRLVPGITYTGTPLAFLAVALVFGVINSVVRPILLFFSLPFLLITLGLFTFIVNAFAFWIASAASSALGLQFHVAGFTAAFLGALIVSVVSTVLSLFVGKNDRREKRHD